MFCPKCKGEYVKGITRCKQCEVPLIASLADAPKLKPEPEKEIAFVSIVRTFNPQDVAIIKSILEDSGIEHYIQGEETIHLRPLVDPANVLVVKERAEDAIALLKDLDLSYYIARNYDNDMNDETETDLPSEVNDAKSEEKA